jgi:hypothetical protein
MSNKPEIKAPDASACWSDKKSMSDGHIVFMVVVIIVLLLTLMMAWVSHRKLKTHELYLAVLLEKYIEDEKAAEDAKAAAAAATTTGSAAALQGSGAALKSSGAETCNDLRSPIGGKIYNRDCLSAKMTGSSSKAARITAAFPNINTVIQKDYNKSG